MYDGGAVVFSASKAVVGGAQEDPERLKSLGFNLWTQDRASTVVWRCGHALAQAPLLIMLQGPGTALRKQPRQSLPARLPERLCHRRTGSASGFQTISGQAESDLAWHCQYGGYAECSW